MTYQESKKIVYEILNEEVKTNNLDLAPSVLTNIENFWHIIVINLKQYYKNPKAKLSSCIKSTKKELNIAKKQQGYSIGSKSEVVILLNNIRKYYQNDTQYLYQIIKTTYHEIKHILIVNQDLTNSNSPHYFYLLTERLLRILIRECGVSDYYEREFQYFYEEILAEQYASTKTTEFLQKKPPETYENDQFLIEYIKQNQLLEKICQTNYDVQKMLNRINKIIKKAPNKERFFVFEFPTYILSSIYNKNGTFKSIKEIFKDQYLRNQPIKAKFELITSEAYLEELDYTTITIEELRVLLNAINYISKLEIEKSKNNKSLREEIELFYKTKEKRSSSNKPNKKTLLTELEEQEYINSIKLLYLETQRNKVQELLNKYSQNKKNKH